MKTLNLNVEVDDCNFPKDYVVQPLAELTEQLSPRLLPPACTVG